MSATLSPASLALAAKGAISKGTSNMLPLPNLSFTGGSAGPAVSGAPVNFGPITMGGGGFNLWTVALVGIAAVTLMIVVKKK